MSFACGCYDVSTGLDKFGMRYYDAATGRKICEYSIALANNLSTRVRISCSLIISVCLKIETETSWSASRKPAISTHCRSIYVLLFSRQQITSLEKKVIDVVQKGACDTK